VHRRASDAATEENQMRLHAGYRLAYDCPQPTPMLLVLNVHPSRRIDLLSDDAPVFDPPLESRGYIDGFGNVCHRIVAPVGRTTISADFEVRDGGSPDAVPRDAVQHDINDLPDEVLVFLLGSRYCETDMLADEYTYSGLGANEAPALCSMP